MFSLILRIIHSVGLRSHQSRVGTNLAQLTRYINRPQAEDRRILFSLPFSKAAICLAILFGASRSSASSHWIKSPWQMLKAVLRAAEAPWFDWVTIRNSFEANRCAIGTV